MNMPANCLQNRIKNTQFVVLVAVGLSLVGSSVAGDGAARSELKISKNEIRNVVSAVSRYARAISCNFKVSPKNVVGLDPYNSDDAKFGKKFFALWDGDIGCAGGPGNYQTHIAIVRFNDAESYLVDPLASSPAVRFESPVQLTTKLIGLDSRTITLEGFEEGPNDPLCCPSVPLRFTLRLDYKDNWVLVEKHILTKSVKELFMKQSTAH